MRNDSELRHGCHRRRPGRLAANGCEGKVSNRVLLSLRDLLTHFPDQIDISECLKKGTDQELLLRVTGWLEGQGIVKLSNGRVQLTEEGRQTLVLAASSNDILAEFLDARRDILTKTEADQAMLAVVRARFNLQCNHS